MEQLNIQGNSESTLNFQHNPFQNIEICHKPHNQMKLPDFNGIINCDEKELYRTQDRGVFIKNIIKKTFIIENYCGVKGGRGWLKCFR